MKKLLILIAFLASLCLGEAKLDSTYYYAVDSTDTMVLIQKLVYTYPDDYTTEQSIYLWMAGFWTNFGNQSWTVDDYGNMTSYTTSFFGYVVTEIITNTYEYGKLVESVSQVDGENYYREIYTYDGDNISEVLMQDWVDGAWVDFSKTTHTYSGNKKMESITQEWIDDDWQNYLRITNSYDGNYLDYWISEEWVTDQWSNLGKYFMIYDNDGLNTEQHCYDWDSTEFVFTEKIIHFYGDGATAVENYEKLPEDFTLTNYPNPFNPNTHICFELPEKGMISLQIFDITGKEVKTIIDNENRDAGYHQVMWDATNNYNIQVPSGVYFYSLYTEETKKPVDVYL